MELDANMADTLVELIKVTNGSTESRVATCEVNSRPPAIEPADMERSDQIERMHEITKDSTVGSAAPREGEQPAHNNE